MLVFWVPQIHWRRNQAKVELQTSEIKKGHAREVVHMISRLMVQSSRLMYMIRRLMPCGIVNWIATESGGSQLVDLYFLLVD